MKDGEELTAIQQQKDIRLLERDEYRVIVYEEMGFTHEQAVVLSKITHLSSASVRETFIKRGCPADLAYKILAP